MATTTDQFILLDENVPKLLGQPLEFTIGQPTSPNGLLPITSLVLFMFLAASGVATIGRILYALGLKTANSDNEAKITEANKIITSSLFALLMSFSLVLLFLVINPDVVKGTVDFSKIVVTSSSSTPSNTTNQTTQSVTKDNTAENTLRKTLNDAKITINKDSCATPSSTNCTDVGGLQQYIIKAVLKLKAKCACDIMITGGSEKAGHSPTSNHYSGNAVDIALTPQLQTFFSNPLNDSLQIGNTAPCNIKYSFAGIIFWDEAPGCDGGLTTLRHYHASFNGR